MKLYRLLSVVLLVVLATTVRAEKISTPPESDKVVTTTAGPADAGTSGKPVARSGKMHGGDHGKKHHGGHGTMHKGKGAGMKHEMMQHRFDMERRISRIEERLAIIQTMLEQLLQR